MKARLGDADQWVDCTPPTINPDPDSYWRWRLRVATDLSARRNGWVIVTVDDERRRFYGEGVVEKVEYHPDTGWVSQIAGGKPLQPVEVTQ